MKEHLLNNAADLNSGETDGEIIGWMQLALQGSSVLCPFRPAELYLFLERARHFGRCALNIQTWTTANALRACGIVPTTGSGFGMALLLAAELIGDESITPIPYSLKEVRAKFGDVVTDVILATTLRPQYDAKKMHAAVLAGTGREGSLARALMAARFAGCVSEFLLVEPGLANAAGLAHNEWVKDETSFIEAMAEKDDSILDVLGLARDLVSRLGTVTDAELAAA